MKKLRRIHVTQLLRGLAIGEVNGGSEVFALRLAQLLDPAVFDVSICVIWSHDSPIERRWKKQLTEQGFPVFFATHYRSQFRLDLEMAYLGAYPIIWRLRPDILNSHTECPDMVGAAIKLTGGVRRLVRTSHNSIEWSFDRRIWRMTSRTYPLVFDKEVGVSPLVAEILNTSPVARLLHKHAPFVANGVDADAVLVQRSTRDMRAELGIAPDVPLFGMVGRLSEQKGVPDLIRAMHTVRAALPNAQLLIIGDGEDRPQLHELLLQEGLAGNISFLGPRTDVMDLIAAFDVFVSSSRWEGLPTVVMEAMVLGTPVVATNIPGSRELIIDGETGWLAPAHRPEALAQAMLDCYADRAAAQARAHKARAHVEQFSMRHAARAYSEIYAALV
jgi:glycosyltransferase involved in cell wall biosynthesis